MWRKCWRRDAPLLYFLPGKGEGDPSLAAAEPTGLLQRLQQSGERFDVVPTAVSYDRIASAFPAMTGWSADAENPAILGLREILSGLRGLWQGALQLGRIHIAFGQPFSLDPRADTATLADRANREIERALVATTHHLRCFVQHHCLDDVDLDWLAQAIRERGGRVLRSRLRDTRGSMAMETPLREQWQQLFLADAEQFAARGLEAGSEEGEPGSSEGGYDARLRQVLSALFDPAPSPGSEARALSQGLSGGGG